jgi:Raf kinase inhibitor-like YbhB/YbcL family protein
MAVLDALFVIGCSSSTDDAADGGGSDSGPGAAAAQAEGGTESTGYQFQQQFELSIVLTSPEFHEKKRIPKKYTCTKLSANDPNISPPLAWTGVPEGTASMALVVDSAEVPGDRWVHWLLWNMPPDMQELTPGVPQDDVLADGSTQGVNSVGGVGYLGPCPSPITPGDGRSGFETQSKTTRSVKAYSFSIYALDSKIDLAPGATREDVLGAIDGHILGAGHLVGERQGIIIWK